MPSVCVRVGCDRYAKRTRRSADGSGRREGTGRAWPGAASGAGQQRRRGRAWALEFVPLELFREQLEVNVIGQLAVIQAFLPLLRETGGRIVNIGSIDGRVATSLLGPYVASKFVLKGLSEALRREPRPWGIQVTVIELDAIKTRIWETSPRVTKPLRAGIEGHHCADLNSERF
jgi:NAD(P)-dependent dehydrogenase (short-subunit alcohol dehydrogenase family)